MVKKLFLVLLIVFCASLADATTYYVRTDGHDTNCNGTADAAAASAPNCAWLTVQKGATTGTCGDTVLVGNGTYAERVTVADACEAETTFTLQSQNKNLAILSSSSAGFRLTGNYIKIDGFKVQGYTSVSYYGSVQSTGNYNTITNMYLDSLHKRSIDVSGLYSTISDNYIASPQWGIWIAGTGHLVTGNEVNQLEIHEAGNDTDYARYFGNNHIFRNNNFHSTNDTMVTVNAGGAHVDCFQTYTEGGGGNSSNTLIEQNICIGAHEGVMASSTTTGSANLTIQNNVFSNIWAYGVALWDVSNTKIYNNTFDLTDGQNGDGGYYAIGCTNGTATCDVRNNIITGTHSGTPEPIYKASGATWITPPVNNLIYRSGKTYSAVTYPAPNIVNQDPLYTSSSDYTLQNGSPAINAGADLSSLFSVDILGYSRPYGAAFDIGAYEKGASSGDETPPTISSAAINAAGTQLTIVASESVVTTISTGFAVTMSGGAATLTYVSGSGTNTLIYNINRIIATGETGTLAYTQPTNGVEDSAGNDLASFSEGTAVTVTNNSSTTPSAETFVVTPSTSTGCVISPLTNQSIATGTTTQFTCTASANYECVAWTGTCGGTGTTTLTTSAITGACTVVQPCKKLSAGFTLR